MNATFFNVAIMIVLAITGCEEKSTERAKTNYGSPTDGLKPKQVVAAFEVNGTIKIESVRGYLVDYAQQYTLSMTSEKLFTLPAVPAGTYKLWIMAEGNAEASGQLMAAEVPLTFTANDTLVPTTTLKPASKIKGTIKASAEILKTISISVPGTDFSTKPNSDGTFSISGLPAAEFVLVIENQSQTLLTTDSIKTTLSAETELSLIDLTSKNPQQPTGVPRKLVGGSVTLANGATKSGVLSVPVTFVASEDANQIKFSEDINLPNIWQAIPNNYVHTFQNSGTKNLYAKFKNQNGIESDLVYGTIDINTAPPAPGTLEISNGSDFTNSRLTALKLTATGVEAMRLSTNRTTLETLSWLTYSENISSFDLGSDNEGQYTIWFQLRSSYGVIGSVQSKVMNLVKTGPSSSAITTVDGRAAYNTNSIQLAVTPGNKPYNISSFTYSCNGIAFHSSSYSNTTNLITINLKETRAGCPQTDGVRNLAISLVDSLGNIGPSRTLAINYDTTQPSPPTIDQDSGNYQQSPTFTITGNAVANGTVTITGGTTETTTTTNGSGIYSAIVNLKLNQLNTLILRAKDEAGNQSAPATILVTHDTIPPLFNVGPLVKLTAETMRFTVTSNEEVTSTVSIGKTAGYGETIVDNSLTNSPSILVSDREQNTIYHYQVIIEDRAGNTRASSDATARTYIDKSALLEHDEVWDQTITPYYVSGNFRINPGIIVKIKKGVKIALEADTQIWIQGTLIAEGTKSEPITFTSNDPQPTPGLWDRLEFNNVSAGSYSIPFFYSSGSKLNHVIVEYGGKNGASILVQQRSFILANTIVQHSSGTAVTVSDKFDTGNLAFRNNTFRSNQSGGIKFMLSDEQQTGGQDVEVSDSLFEKNLLNVMNVLQFDNVNTNRNRFIENNGGVLIGNGSLTVSESIFYKNPGSFIFNIKQSILPIELNLSATRNAFLSTISSVPLIEDRSVITDEDNKINANFSSSVFHGNSTGAGAGLISFEQPNNFNTLLADTLNVNLGNNNFINNNVGFNDRYVLLTKSFREYQDIHAENNFWGSNNQLTVQQKHIFDYADNNNYRAVDYLPIQTKIVTNATIAPPTNLAVTADGGGSTTLSWTINQETDVGGYYVYYSTDPKNMLAGTGATEGPSKIDTSSGDITCSLNTTTYSCVLNGLTPSTTYYFAVTAYDGGDLPVKSFFSNGVNIGADTITVTAHGFRQNQRVKVTTGLVSDPCTIPTGLSNGINYWVNVVDQNTITLRTTEALGNVANITAGQTGTCQIVANLPMYTGSNLPSVNATVDVNTNIVTQLSHGYTNGVRGNLTDVGTLLGAKIGTDYYVTKIDANSFYLSQDGQGVTPVDFGLDNGYDFIDAEVSIANNRFYIQGHLLPNDTPVKFSSTQTLPSPLNTIDTYYVISADANSFQVSSSVGGASIDITAFNNTPTEGRHKVVPTIPGSGPITFLPNYPDILKQDYQVLGNESWFSNSVNIEVD